MLESDESDTFLERFERRSCSAMRSRVNIGKLLLLIAFIVISWQIVGWITTTSNSRSGESEGDNSVDPESITDPSYSDYAPINLQETLHHNETIEIENSPKDPRIAKFHDLKIVLDEFFRSKHRPVWHKDHKWCNDSSSAFTRYSCTPHGYAYETDFPFIGQDVGCDLLSVLEIKKIFFIGDSFVRQAFATLKMTLISDYENGAMPDEYPRDLNCTGEDQYTNKACRVYTMHRRTVCGDVEMDVVYDGYPIINPEDHAK